MSDTQWLVRRCQEGELDAFTALFRHFQNHVYALACAILRDEPAAEDVVQDTFLAVFQHIDSYNGDSTFKTRLTAVAVNECRMRLRKRHPALSWEHLRPGRHLRAGSRGEDLSDVVYRRHQRQTLWAMVDDMPDRLRLPMILRYRYALPCNDIALILGKRKSTIYQEGRRELKKMAEQSEPRESRPALTGAPGLE